MDFEKFDDRTLLTQGRDNTTTTTKNNHFLYCLY